MTLIGGGSGADVGIIQTGAYTDYQTLLSNLGITYSMVPDNPTSSDLIGIDILILDGAGSGLTTSEIAVYQTYYNNGGCMWISYDDISTSSVMSSFANLIGAASLADNPDYDVITFTQSTFPSGDPTNVMGMTFDFGQADQDVVTPASCVILDNHNEASILDGGGKYVLYLGDTISSVTNLNPTGTLGRLFDSYYDMVGGGCIANGTIPGPGYSTWVYYYVNATNLGGQSADSATFSYYADGTPPTVLDFTDVTIPMNSQENITISTNVTDDYYLDYVMLWFNNGTGWYSVFMNFVSGNATSAMYSADIPASGFETTVDYYIEVFDMAGNWNISTTDNYLTNAPPKIENIYNVPPNPNGTSVCEIYATITDSDGVSLVEAQYSTDGITYTPITMTISSGNVYSCLLPVISSSTPVYFYIEATDSLGFFNSTSTYSFYVDADPPQFGVPSIEPEFPNSVVDVNVTIPITDNVNVTDATLHYSYDGSSWTPTSMNITGGSGGTVQILAYTQYTDYFQEYQRTLMAIDQTTTNYAVTEFSDWTQIDTYIPGKDILLIPEQQFSNFAAMQNIGFGWRTTLTNFLNGGGTVIVCVGSGDSHGILTGSSLMSISSSSFTGGILSVVDPADPLADSVSPFFPDPSSTKSFNTAESNVVIQDGSGWPVVINKAYGSGFIALIGFDYFEYTNVDANQVIGNAVVGSGGFGAKAEIPGPGFLRIRQTIPIHQVYSAILQTEFPQWSWTLVM
jgi:hypothetical protein